MLVLAELVCDTVEHNLEPPLANHNRDAKQVKAIL